MLRLVALIAGLSLAAACGTPCSRVASAEENANARGKGCNGLTNTRWTSSQLKSCEENLPNCSENDLKQIDLYASCLNSLPVCSEGQTTSWTVQRGACLTENIVLKLGLRCASGF